MTKCALGPHLYAVVMAGGKGTRFWPFSREKYPKQFLKLAGERSLLQDTLHRLADGIPPERTLIVTTHAQRDLVVWQSREMAEGIEIIAEPEGRNTAPAVALVAFKLAHRDPEAEVLVLPSDHFVADIPAFLATVGRASEQAGRGRIVTFGVKPTRPETGYGYIKAGGLVADGVHDVAEFVEKPDLDTAMKYLASGQHYWNSGMFLFRASDMIAEIEKHLPATYAAMRSAMDAMGTPGEAEAVARAYKRVDATSIDYGVMEKCGRMTMVSASFPWSDIGSWGALEEVLPSDKDGNVAVGNVVAIDCEGSIFYTGEKLVAAVGLKDTVVVDTKDATMVVPRSEAQRVKDLVEKLKESGRQEYLAPMYEERPWGYFAVLDHGPSYKIKHICVYPEHRLSLQMHSHRSEHWIVVSGTAKVTRGEEDFFVRQNESTFIPPATKHRLENPGLIPLRIIEIQSGEYLGEDDIIRLDDIYGRQAPNGG